MNRQEEPALSIYYALKQGMTPKDRGKAQAQAKIGALKEEVERMVAEAMLECGYEDETPGVCDAGPIFPPITPPASNDRTRYGKIYVDPDWWGTPKKERWFAKIWQRLKK
jgi:hypothetical protein